MSKPEKVGKERLSEVIDLVSRAFKYPDGEKISRDFPLFFAEANADHLFAIFNDTPTGKELASHAGTYRSNLLTEEDSLKVGGIGGVATGDEFQGKGYGKSVIEACVQDLEQSDCDLAFLWSGEHDFFRKFGFELVGAQWSITVPPGTGSQIESELNKVYGKAKRADYDKIEVLEGARHIYKDGLKLYASHPLRLERDQEEFKALVSSEGCRVFSAHFKGELIAYAILGKGIDLPGHIHEWAGTELGLIRILKSIADAETEDVIVLAPQFTPAEAPFIYFLEGAGFDCSLGYMAMVKVINFQRVRQVVVNRINRLAMEPSFLRMERMEDGTYTLGWATDPDIAMTESEFLQFIFGPRLPSEQVALPADSAAALDSLLPIRLWWWGMDSV